MYNNINEDRGIIKRIGSGIKSIFSMFKFLALGIFYSITTGSLKMIDRSISKFSTNIVFGSARDKNFIKNLWRNLRGRGNAPTAIDVPGIEEKDYFDNINKTYCVIYSEFFNGNITEDQVRSSFAGIGINTLISIRRDMNALFNLIGGTGVIQVGDFQANTSIIETDSSELLAQMSMLKTDMKTEYKEQMKKYKEEKREEEEETEDKREEKKKEEHEEKKKEKKKEKEKKKKKTITDRNKHTENLSDKEEKDFETLKDSGRRKLSYQKDIFYNNTSVNNRNDWFKDENRIAYSSYLGMGIKDRNYEKNNNIIDDAIKKNKGTDLEVLFIKDDNGTVSKQINNDGIDSVLRNMFIFIVPKNNKDKTNAVLRINPEIKSTNRISSKYDIFAVLAEETPMLPYKYVDIKINNDNKELMCFEKGGKFIYNRVSGTIEVKEKMVISIQGKLNESYNNDLDFYEILNEVERDFLKDLDLQLFEEMCFSINESLNENVAEQFGALFELDYLTNNFIYNKEYFATKRFDMTDMQRLTAVGNRFMATYFDKSFQSAMKSSLSIIQKLSKQQGRIEQYTVDTELNKTIKRMIEETNFGDGSELDRGIYGIGGAGITASHNVGTHFKNIERTTSAIASKGDAYIKTITDRLTKKLGKYEQRTLLEFRINSAWEQRKLLMTRAAQSINESIYYMPAWHKVLLYFVRYYPLAIHMVASAIDNNGILPEQTMNVVNKILDDNKIKI